MQKIPFNNLPSTDYPINATNLNQLQNNVENAFKNSSGTSEKDTYSQAYLNRFLNSIIKSSYSKNKVTDTGINVNGGNAGKAALVLTSGNYSSGSSVIAGLYLIKFGYSNDYFKVNTILEDGTAGLTPIWSILENKNLGVTCTGSGNVNILFLIID